MSAPDAPAALLMLLGPTASGKSAAAMALAARLPVEIVSVDSALVYRGLDIGTAKPSPAERRQVPHHLIDLIEPTRSYSAARFVSDARAAIDAIRARGRLPLLVGGTMLYAKALIEGLHALPQADPALRVRLEDQARALGWPALHARLARFDAPTAARLDPNDSQRIQRALEIFELSGTPMSAWLAGTRAPARDGRPGMGALQDADADADVGANAEVGAGADTAADERIVTIALEPSQRSVLHERIALRFAAMIDAGFIDEVRALHARGDLHPGLPSMRCVGYRQLWQWIDAGEPGGAARERTIEAGIAATRQLAKRQLTWLRSMPQREIIDCLAPDRDARVLAAVRRAIDEPIAQRIDHAR